MVTRVWDTGYASALRNGRCRHLQIRMKLPRLCEQPWGGGKHEYRMDVTAVEGAVNMKQQAWKVKEWRI